MEPEEGLIQTLVKTDPPLLKEIRELYTALYNKPNKDLEALSGPTSNLSELDVILNALFPDHEWTDKNGRRWVQKISRDRPSRNDIAFLRLNLAKVLEGTQSRSRGICPLRGSIFNQAFSEVIRQVAIDSPDRGSLLLRVRQEFRMTLESTSALSQASIIYGIEKTRILDESASIGTVRTEEEHSRVGALKRRRDDLRLRMEHARLKHSDRMECIQKGLAHDVQFLKRVHQQLKHQLEVLSTMDFS